MSRCCVIFGGGDPVSAEIVKAELSGGEYLIAADSGYRLMQQLSLEPELIIGDFDSAPEPETPNKQVFPVEKDDTDLMLAIKAGLSAGCKSFRLFGVTGGRLDHTIAAIQSLAYLSEHQAFGEIISDNERIALLAPGKHTVPKREGYTLSLFAYTESVQGLSVRGVKYKAENITLTNSFPLGVSNSITDAEAGITFTDGCLLVIASRL